MRQEIFTRIPIDLKLSIPKIHNTEEDENSDYENPDDNTMSTIDSHPLSPKPTIVAVALSLQFCVEETPKLSSLCILNTLILLDITNMKETFGYFLNRTDIGGGEGAGS